MSTDGTVNGGRFSSLTQINTSNVQDLHQAWSFKTNIPGAENYPVVVNGVAYVTTAYGFVFALNAATGKQLWKWTPPKQQAEGLVSSAHGFPNRGVAFGGGNVYVLTPNALVVAINAKTGKTVWSTPSIKDAVKLGYTESTAPIYYNGKLYVGSSGGDVGTRGFEEALNASNGKLDWRFFTVPKRGTSWLKATGNHGGGDVWMVPTLDPHTDILYVSVGNPSPDFYAANRPGIDKYTDSVVALNADTGKLIWSYSEAPHDEWDYDAVSPTTLFPTQGMLAAGEAGKDGYWYEWNAKTGQPITMPEPFVKEHHVMPPINGPKVEEWPGSGGGSEWSPVPYDPQTHYTYVEGINSPSWEKAVPANAANHKVGQLDVATAFFPQPPGTKNTGTLTAFNVADGTIAWQTKEPVGMVGGTTATAGGLLFVGQSGTGLFQALDAQSGKLLWQQKTGGRIDDAASVYSVNGTEYVLIAVGGTSIVPHFGGMSTSNATFIAYKLGNTPTWTPGQHSSSSSSSSQSSSASSKRSSNGQSSSSQGASGSSSISKGSTSASSLKKVNTYMSYDTKAKTVDLNILGGVGSDNGGFNFNGKSFGKLNISVPEGWKVKINFTNKGLLNHSLVVLTPKASPNPPLQLAFKGAGIANPLVGLKTGGSASFSFVASKAGKYKFVCVVPGHDDLGMWDWFTVTTSGTPSYNSNYTG